MANTKRKLKIGEVLRHVLDPYIRPIDNTTTALKPGLFDYSRCYRVMLDSRKNLGEYFDAIYPGAIGGRDSLKKYNFIRLFYVGAELDLDRYLRFLHDVGFRHKNKDSRLIVIEQYTNVAQTNLQGISRADVVPVLIRPGRLSDYGLLASVTNSRRKGKVASALY